MIISQLFSDSCLVPVVIIQEMLPYKSQPKRNKNWVVEQQIIYVVKYLITLPVYLWLSHGYSQERGKEIFHDPWTGYFFPETWKKIKFKWIMIKGFLSLVNWLIILPWNVKAEI